MLIHGFGAYGHFWRKWVPHLSERHRTLSVDLMGFGRAAAPRGGDFSPEAQSERISALVRALDGGPVVLAGHSLGAGIALLAALDLAPARVAGLVLVSAAVYRQSLPPYLTLLRNRGIGELFLLAPPPAWAIARGIRGIVEDRRTVDTGQVEGYRAPLRDRARRRAILRAARQVDVGSGDRLASRLGELGVPALLIWGDRDRVVPPEFGRRLARELGNADLVLLEGVGHLPPEEAPRRSVEPVLRFLQSLGPSRREAPSGSA